MEKQSSPEDREESDYSDDERSEHSRTNRQILADENPQIFIRQYIVTIFDYLWDEILK